MKVIARTDGPKYNGENIFHLTKDKVYDAISFSTHDGMKWVDHEIKTNDVIFIPRTPIIYIDVISDRNIVETFWCDYFISTQEMRNLKLKQLNEKR